MRSRTPSAPRSAHARVTVVAPHTRVDLALPHGSTLAELLPTLLRISGADLAGAAGSRAWSLSRLGQPALDTGRTVEAHRLRDGEVLHLHPRTAQPPPPVFDDVVDAVATAAGERGRSWSPECTRTTGLVGAGTLLVASAVVPLVAGGDAATRAGVCAGVASVLLATALLLSRAVGDAAAAMPSAVAAVAHAAASGVLTVYEGAPLDAGRSALGGAAAGAALAAVLAGVAVGDRLPVFAGLAAAGAFAAVAALAATSTETPPAGAAAATLAGILTFLPTLPVLALRLARLPALLPADLAHPRREIRGDVTVPEEDVAAADTLARADTAARHLSALVCSAAVVAAGSGVLLVVSGGTAARWLAGSAAVALLLRGRLHFSRVQRAAFLVSGAVVATATATVLGGAATPGDRLVWAYGGALLTGAGVLAAALLLPERRHSPYWGQLADICEVVALVAVLPLALAVLDVYAWVRALGG